MKTDIFCLHVMNGDPVYIRHHQLPDDAKKVFSDKRINSAKKFENGEWVAAHNYRRNNQLRKMGLAVEIYVSKCPSSFEALLD